MTIVWTGGDQDEGGVGLVEGEGGRENNNENNNNGNLCITRVCRYS